MLFGSKDTCLSGHASVGLDSSDVDSGEEHALVDKSSWDVAGADVGGDGVSVSGVTI